MHHSRNRARRAVSAPLRARDHGAVSCGFVEPAWDGQPADDPALLRAAARPRVAFAAPFSAAGTAPLNSGSSPHVSRIFRTGNGGLGIVTRPPASCAAFAAERR